MSDFILWSSPIVAALSVWLANKLYESLTERIETAKGIVRLDQELESLRKDVKSLNITATKLSRDFVALQESSDSSMSLLHQKVHDTYSAIIIADKKLTTSLNRIDTHEKHLENYGKVIQAIARKISK